jgi:hypothetical protein
MMLSEHFSLREMSRSSVADRLGIDNTPPWIASDNMCGLCENILEPVRKNFKVPFSPMSGYRSIDLNRAIGSRDTSQHILGEAVDIEIPGVSNLDLARWIEGAIEYDQLILEHFIEGEPSSGWVHVSFKKKDPPLNRMQSAWYTGEEWRVGLP